MKRTNKKEERRAKCQVQEAFGTQIRKVYLEPINDV